MLEAIETIQKQLSPKAKLIAVSKTKPIAMLAEAYDLGLRIFGENKVQEMTEKYAALPKDIQWHFIGHLQSNKIKYMADYVTLIHGVDSLKLLQEIDKQAKKANRVIDCLLQIYIADEDTKFGFSQEEVIALLQNNSIQLLSNICVKGLMGMASNTTDVEKIRTEFRGLHNFFQYLQSNFVAKNLQWQEISMGMSNDYQIALEEGSTMIRIGSAIFGSR
jgi:pyridoxal phosphate enzyme (YggS family)